MFSIRSIFGIRSDRVCRLGAKEVNFWRKNYGKVIERFGRKGLPFYSNGASMPATNSSSGANYKRSVLRLSYDFLRGEGEKDRWARVAALSSAARVGIWSTLTV
jgi:hypothetical protein